MGITFARTLRDMALGMRDKQAALELVLDAYEEVVGKEEDAYLVARLHGLTAVQSYMFVLMNKRLGKLVTFEALYRLQEIGRKGSYHDDYVATKNTTSVQICTMRRILRGRYHIDNVHSKGYIMREWTGIR